MSEEDQMYVPEEVQSGAADAEHAEMTESGHHEGQHDPWFPDAEAAASFPEGQTIPEGMTYDEWRGEQR